MAVDYKPRDYGSALTEFAMLNERGNLWAGMGCGKTVCTATALQGLALVEDPFPALVLAPLRVANSTWPAEFEKWRHLAGVSVQSAAGGREPMRTALRQLADVTTINYDNVVDLVEHFGGAWPFRTVIADESTRLKSYRTRQGGKRAQALGKVAHKHTRRWLNLTGTPAPNGLIDLWGPQWFIDEGRRLGRTFSAFEQRWFAYRRKNDALSGRADLVMEVREGAQEQIEALLADCTMTVRAGDFLDLPPLVENVIEVELPARAMRHYRDLERELFTVLADGTEIEAFNAGSKTQKCLQAAAGALYKDPAADGDEHPRSREWVEIHDVKIDALRSVVSEASGMPVLVAYHFKSDLARLRKAFPEGRELDKNPQTIVDWNAGRVPILFAHPQSAGHGLNLQAGGNILVYFTSWWNLECDEQILERIGPTRQAQSGFNRPVYVHRIVAKGTLDRVVLRRLQTKASVQSLLLDAMKGRQ